MARMDLGSWTIFSLLDTEFTAQIRLTSVYGNLGNEALIVTRDGEVLGFVTTLGPTSWVINSCYFPFNISNLIPVSAFTESGEFYSWGNYGYCQLGNESMNQSLNPALVQNSLLGRNVVLPREEGVRLGIQQTTCSLDSATSMAAWTTEAPTALANWGSEQGQLVHPNQGGRGPWADYGDRRHQLQSHLGGPDPGQLGVHVSWSW